MLDSHCESTPDFDSAVHVLSEFAYANLPRPPSAEAEKPTDTTLQERFAPQWVDLLRRAVEEPGMVSEAYTRFHGYSLGNRFAALLQCRMRGLEPGPLSTFHGWRKLGYAVQEGERALTLCMPIKGVLAREKAIAPAVAAQRSDPLPDIEEIEYIRAFVWKPHWYVLAQTQPIDPETVQPVSIPVLNGWDKDKALAALDIQETPFTHLDGNTQGYAQGRQIAVSPLAEFPYKTLFHEMAHIVLGHASPETNPAPLVDTMSLPRSQLEVEAEGVALLLLDTFDLPGQEFSRGYIQHWLEGEAIPEKSAQRIFGGADRILSAGLGEGRVRFPTAEDLAWTGGESAVSTQPVTGTQPLMGTETVNNSTPVTFTVAAPVPTAPATVTSAPQSPVSLTTTRWEPEKGEEAAPAVASIPSASLPVPAVSADSSPADALLAASLTEALAVPDGAEHAWKLHERLMQLHSELHPDAKAERQSIARAVSYLERLDPTAATQVRELVTNASRSLKAAFDRLESSLEESGLDEGWEEPAEWEDSGVETKAETASHFNGYHPTPAASTFGTSAIHTPGVLFALEPSSGELSQSELSQDELSPLAPPPLTISLSAMREAAARRTVGRDLRQELREAKQSFLNAAKAHDLKVGGPHQKAMLAALGEFLGVPVPSRRTPTAQQWLQGASAIETEDLRW